MTKMYFLALLFSSITTLACQQARAAEWQLLTHSTGGQVKLVEGSLHGIPHAGKRAFFVELVTELQNRLGMHVAIEDVPLARGLAELAHNDKVALFNLDMTPERKNLMKWVGPIWQETAYLYEASNRPTGLAELAQARDIPTCVLNQNVHDQILSRMNFTRLERNNSYDGCLKMLVAGRVKLVAVSSFELDKKLDLAGVPHDAVRQLPIVVNDSPGYIALSRSTPDTEVKRWQRALDEIRKSGRYQWLYQQYVEPLQ